MHILSLLYVMLWMSKDATAGQQCKAVESSARGNALKNHTFKSVAVGHPVECPAICQQDPICQSYNFFIPKKLCELNDRTKETNPKILYPTRRGFTWGSGD